LIGSLGEDIVDTKQIKELMSSMEESGVTKIFIKEKTGFELQLERQLPVLATEVPHTHSSTNAHASSFYVPSKHHEFPHVPQHAHPHAPAAPQEGDRNKEQEGKFICSPMVGTFYAASSPEHAAFMKVGDVVHEGSVVCIIEAMKVMNEVKAGMSGTVAEICVENGHPVEFGTKLFRIV